MGRIEALIVGMCIGIVCPVGLFFASWWTSVFLLPGRAIPIAALGGLAAGLLLDAVFLRRWTRHVYGLHAGFLIPVYLCFSIIVLAICMGVPVLNTTLGIVAGAYMGRRLHHAKADGEQLRRGVRHVSLFTAAVIIMISSLSAGIALASASTPRDLQGMLQGMLNLSLTVTWPMIIGLIVTGGIVLVLFQYWLTKAAAVVAYRLGRNVGPQFLIPNP